MKKIYNLASMENKEVLILGGLGFIGSNIAHKCVELGAKVTIFDAMIEPFGFNLANIKTIKGKVSFAKKDMRNFKDLARAVKEKEYIFNCAGQVSHSDSMKTPFLDIELNVSANMNLMEACRKYNDSAKIVYAGTRSQIGKAHYLPVDENHPDFPLDIYGANKLAAEKYLLIYYNAYGIRGTSIRLNTTFGPRHQMKHSLYGVLNWFIRLCLENKKITVYGDGTQLREYNYVDDTADAMILAAQRNKSDGQIYLLGATRPIKFVDMVKEVIKMCNCGEYEIVPFPKERKSIEIGDFNVSIKKINESLGWYPKTSFEDGLKRTVEFYRQNMADYF